MRANRARWTRPRRHRASLRPGRSGSRSVPSERRPESWPAIRGTPRTRRGPTRCGPEVRGSAVPRCVPAAWAGQPRAPRQLWRAAQRDRRAAAPAASGTRTRDRPTTCRQPATPTRWPRRRPLVLPRSHRSARTTSRGGAGSASARARTGARSRPGRSQPARARPRASSRAGSLRSAARGGPTSPPSVDAWPARARPLDGPARAAR